jgi:hypothetical protein
MTAITGLRDDGGMPGRIAAQASSLTTAIFNIYFRDRVRRRPFGGHLGIDAIDPGGPQPGAFFGPCARQIHQKNPLSRHCRRDFARPYGLRQKGAHNEFVQPARPYLAYC